MKDFILSILKKLTKNQLITLVMILGTAFGGKLYIDNKKPEVIPVDNTIQIQLKTLSSEFYRFKKYEIEKDAINKRSHEIDINNLQKEFDAKVILVADHLESVESKRVKNMLEFAESVKPKEIPIPTEPRESIEQPIPTDIEDSIILEPCTNEILVKDTLIKKSLFKKFIGIFNKDTLK